MFKVLYGATQVTIGPRGAKNGIKGTFIINITRQM